MSRVGYKPIALPDGVAVEVAADHLQIKGPQGELLTPVPEGVRFVVEDGELRADRDGDAKQLRANHGLARALAANAVIGVSEGYKKTLEIQGIGYRANMQGKTLVLQLGFSHPVEFDPPEGIELAAPDQTTIEVSGADKQKVGEVAAEIRRLRPPDVYKGKGIRYRGEVVRKKVGKAGVSTMA